ncbi:MAG: DUF2293 domain-containing protein [Planctomycetota bacterium]
MTQNFHEQTLEVSPGPDEGSVRHSNGQILRLPSGWARLDPGDAGLTRKVKSMGPTWTVKEKKGRRTFSKGVWAEAAQIESARQAVEAIRQTDGYKQRLAKDREKRALQQAEYVDEFHQAVVAFLGFHSRYASLADQMAHRITAHATPVGSGTVARTQRIPLEKRASAAVIAWMRHATTEYDDMKIRRIKGERRAVRRELARQSQQILDKYRRGAIVDASDCPLQQAVVREP